MSLNVVKYLTVAGLAAVCVSCGGGGGGYSSTSSPSSPSSTPTANAATITITSRNGSQSFSPNPASLGGQMVVFKNADSIPHHVVLNDGSVDTGTIQPGATSAAVQMPSTGTNYHCSLHPDMVGAVSPASGGSPPPCTGAYCDGSGAGY